MTAQGKRRYIGIKLQANERAGIVHRVGYAIDGHIMSCGNNRLREVIDRELELRRRRADRWSEQTRRPCAGKVAQVLGNRQDVLVREQTEVERRLSRLREVEVVHE